MGRRRYGYNPEIVKPLVIKGASVLERIQYDKLWIVASGGSGVVVTDGMYAIKIGRISPSDVGKLEEAAALGWAMPVMYYEQSITVDQRIVSLIRNAGRIMGGGYGSDADDFLRGAYGNVADIMVSLYAESFLDPQKGLEYEPRQKAYEVVLRVKAAFNKRTGMSWYDSHPWNLGVYNNSYIIFDF